MRAFGLALLLAGSAASAQVRPQPISTDPMQQSVRYSDGQTVILEVAPGFQLTVELGDGETIASAVTGDSARWQVLATAGAGQFYVRPAAGAASTNLTVVTNRHRHYFLLVPAAQMSTQLPLSVRIDDTETQQAAATSAPPAPLTPPDNPAGSYKLSGSADVRPSLIWDDGVKTYLDWPENAEVPAVYAIGPDGKEMLVNSYVRDGRFVIDAIYSALLFRLDKSVGRAERRRERAS